MPVKPKIKVITEEIKEEEQTQSASTPASEVNTDEKTSIPESKITSFSTLDVNPQPMPETPLDKPTNPESSNTLEDNQQPQTKSILEADITQDKPQLDSEDVKKWLNDIRPDTSKEIEKGSKNGFKIFLIVFLLLIAIGLAVGGFFYYKNSSKVSSDNSQNGGVPTSHISPTPTPTPKPTEEAIDLKKYKVQVLNGSGVTGEAKKVSELLVKNGFSAATVGNASRQDYTDTIIEIKDGVAEEVFEKIKNSLGDSYDVTLSEKPLESKSIYDIVVTIGKRKSS
jgi:hypothetical protein